jgi:hypothetical protein
MSRSEQRKQIEDLKYYEGSMTREDRYEFEMLLKRDKDDEDLDSIARGILERLSERYIRRKSKRDIEEAWKKLTSKSPRGES